MRILLVKTSSLGDVVHNLPVVSDIRRNFPDAREWLGTGFAELVPLTTPSGNVRSYDPNLRPQFTHQWNGFVESTCCV